jgi:hypothetical protein
VWRRTLTHNRATLIGNINLTLILVLLTLINNWPAAHVLTALITAAAKILLAAAEICAHHLLLKLISGKSQISHTAGEGKKGSRTQSHTIPLLHLMPPLNYFLLSCSTHIPPQ